MKTDPKAPDYVRVKREKRGVCNICLAPCDLKWDHVPPRGGTNVAPLDQYTIIERLTGCSNNPNRILTQNGVKFRTLCQECNSKLLGGQYDTTLNDFAHGVGRFLKSTLSFPATVTYATRPACLLRAVFGHLLAAKAEIEHTRPDEAMRQFVLSPTAALPPDLNVFYWIYPYPEVHVVRDVVMPSRYASLADPGIFSMLKYFPVAYMITNLKEYEGLPSLSVHCSVNIDAEALLPIPLTGTKPSDWPDDANNIVAGAGIAAHSSISAYPKRTYIR